MYAVVDIHDQVSDGISGVPYNRTHRATINRVLGEVTNAGYK